MLLLCIEKATAGAFATNDTMTTEETKAAATPKNNEGELTVFLKKHGLEKYTEVLRNLGYSNYDAILEYSNEQLRELTKQADMVPGHATNFLLFAREAQKYRGYHQLSKNIPTIEKLKKQMKEHGLARYVENMIRVGYDNYDALLKFKPQELASIAAELNMLPGHARVFTKALEEEREITIVKRTIKKRIDRMKKNTAYAGMSEKTPVEICSLTSRRERDARKRALRLSNVCSPLL